MANVLSFLKKIGKGIVRVLPIATSFAPAVATSIGGPAAGLVVSNILEKITAAVGFAERTAITLQNQGVSLDGKGKLALALSIANDAISPVELIAGRNIIDNEKFQRGSAKFQEGVAKLVEAVADIQDSVE